MLSVTFFNGARWLLTRLLLALLVALAVAVFARQFTDGGDNGNASTVSPTPTATPTVTPPRIGDHWHATYQVIICGQRQPNFPLWLGGIHTHDDGVIHTHPFIPSEEGAGARLVKWFEYGGGKLTQSEMRMPATRETYKNGDTCDDGTEAVLQLSVNGERLDDWGQYIPQDGDSILIVFGPQ